VKTISIAFLTLAAFGAAWAGDIHGKVVCSGASDNANSVVYVAAISGKTFEAPKEHAKMNQQNLVFIPKVLPVLAGTTVDFLNSDTVAHNVFTPAVCAEKFNLGTWPKGETRSKTFKKECVAPILCLVHPEMEAFVIVSPTPYFASTKSDGTYTISNVPDGSYTVKVWHAKMKPAQKPVKVAGATAADFEVSR
jgi:plastocyanin